MHIVYSLALGLALVLATPWWAWQMLRAQKYRAGLAERLGRGPARLRAADAAGAIWVHAVSVGEVLALSSIVADLRREHPERRVVISTTTLAGQKLARQRFGEGDVFYFPLDFSFAIRPYLRALRPSLVVLAETEFWPNFLRLAKTSGARIAVVNARISDRSFPRYRRFRVLFARALRHVDVFLAQSEEDARRLVEIGARPERVRVGGNLKFDIAPPKDVPFVGEFRDALARGGATHVIVAGSTLAGEEEALVLRAFPGLLAAEKNAVLVLAPRHPERFAQVAGMLQDCGLPWWKRSEWRPGQTVRAGVLLLDSIGELAAIYRLATVAFVGGSLVSGGGHNIVEPARFGVPVLVGPHSENFRDIVAIFLRAGALRVVSEQNLHSTLVDLCSHPDQRAQLGERAARVVDQQQGATARTVAALRELLAGGAMVASDAHPAQSHPVTRA